MLTSNLPLLRRCTPRYAYRPLLLLPPASVSEPADASTAAARASPEASASADAALAAAAAAAAGDAAKHFDCLRRKSTSSSLDTSSSEPSSSAKPETSKFVRVAASASPRNLTIAMSTARAWARHGASESERIEALAPSSRASRADLHRTRTHRLLLFGEATQVNLTPLGPAVGLEAPCAHVMCHATKARSCARVPGRVRSGWGRVPSQRQLRIASRERDVGDWRVDRADVAPHRCRLGLLLPLTAHLFARAVPLALLCHTRRARALTRAAHALTRAARARPAPRRAGRAPRSVRPVQVRHASAHCSRAHVLFRARRRPRRATEPTAKNAGSNPPYSGIQSGNKRNITLAHKLRKYAQQIRGRPASRKGKGTPPHIPMRARARAWYRMRAAAAMGLPAAGRGRSIRSRARHGGGLRRQEVRG